MALFYAAIRRGLVSLFKFPFLSHVHVFSREMSLVSRLISGYCRSAGPRVVSIVIGGCNKSSSMLFYDVLDVYRRVHAVFNA